jgi:ankyrin repeat protein
MSKNPRHELMKVARKGHIVRIERLLAKGVDVNSRAKFGQTALFEAVFTGQIDAVRFLLANGADPRLVSNDEAGPLFFACARGSREIVNCLIEHGANVNEMRRTEYANGDVHFSTPLDVATYGGHEMIVKRLTEAGAVRGFEPGRTTR